MKIPVILTIFGLFFAQASEAQNCSLFGGFQASANSQGECLQFCLSNYEKAITIEKKQWQETTAIQRKELAAAEERYQKLSERQNAIIASFAGPLRYRTELHRLQEIDIPVAREAVRLARSMVTYPSTPTCYDWADTSYNYCFYQGGFVFPTREECSAAGLR